MKTASAATPPGVRSDSHDRARAGPPGSRRHLLDLAGDAFAGAAGRVEEHLVEGRIGGQPEPLAQLGLQRRRRALPDDQAVVDDGETVAELVGLLEVLGGEEDRRAALR